ncbi:unnamed protein product [Diatraea saccharalis]|uniref:unspecific monooxygenase n=1 Tax=Diatraea saccharalis TaxID=40085 RepID=A0A9N9R523_9NEOP|nr:unnamed protein product [Diatraea saccharalis]
MALILVFTSLIIVLLYVLLKRNKQYWRKLNIVGPKPHLLFGNYKDVILRHITHFEFHEEVYKAYPKEKVVGLYRFNTPVLLLRDLDIIQHVFIRGFDSFINRGFEFGDNDLNMNLAGSADDTWRMLRTRFSPIFTSGKLKNMVYLMERCGDKMLKELDSQKLSSMDLNVQEIALRYTSGAISACAFGIDMDKPDEKLLKLEKMLFKNYFALELFYICPNLLKKLGFNAVPKFISDYFHDLVKLVKTQRNNKPSGRKDFMDLILEMINLSEIKGGQKNGNKDDEPKVLQITDELIAAQAMIFYAAGYDTTANTLSHMLYELAKHQDIQEKLYEEIKKTLEENNGELSLETLKQMSYMDQVFSETLRMYAIADVQRKVSAKSCRIPGVDINLKRDALMFVSIRGIHYDEEYYPEPYKFDPTRFSQEKVKSRHPCAYLPFGLGPRHCIGMRFAKIQSKVFLVKFLNNYKVEPAAATKKLTFDPMKITLSVAKGVPLKVIRRNK